MTSVSLAHWSVYQRGLHELSSPIHCLGCLVKTVMFWYTVEVFRPTLHWRKPYFLQHTKKLSVYSDSWIYELEVNKLNLSAFLREKTVVSLPRIF